MLTVDRRPRRAEARQARARHVCGVVVVVVMVMVVVVSSRRNVQRYRFVKSCTRQGNAGECATNMQVRRDTQPRQKCA